MGSEKSLATRTRQRSHSIKQKMYYALHIKKRGYSRKFVKMREYAISGRKPPWYMLFRQRFIVAKTACFCLFFPGKGRVLVPEGRLYAEVIRKDGSVEDLGLISTRVVTDVFVDYLVDQLQSSSGGIAEFRYHGSGISSAAELQTNTALASEVDTRATGTQLEGASSNIYKTQGTVDYAAAFAIVEHGLFRAATGDVLADRSVFAAINVDNGDSIKFTYELTLPAGS